MTKSTDRTDAKRFRDSTTIVSVSMHGSAKLALARIAEADGLGVSELVRLALTEYASKHGHRAEVENFEEDES